MSNAVIEELVEMNGCIWGYIYEDKKGRFKDGEVIRTSKITAPVIDQIDEYMTIHTKKLNILFGCKSW